jgi:hypothetical protein
MVISGKSGEPTNAYIALPVNSSWRCRNSRSRLSREVLTLATNSSQAALLPSFGISRASSAAAVPFASGVSLCFQYKKFKAMVTFHSFYAFEAECHGKFL